MKGRIVIIIFIRTRSTQHEQIIHKIDGTVQQILKLKAGEQLIRDYRSYNVSNL